MAMTAQLDVNATLIIDACQSFEQRWKIHLAFPEHEVFVKPAPHIFNMHVPQNIAPGAEYGSRSVPLLDNADGPDRA